VSHEGRNRGHEIEVDKGTAIRIVSPVITGSGQIETVVGQLPFVLGDLHAGFCRACDILFRAERGYSSPSSCLRLPSHFEDTISKQITSPGRWDWPYLAELK